MDWVDTTSIDRLQMSSCKIINLVSLIFSAVATLIFSVYPLVPAYAQETSESIFVSYASQDSAENICQGSRGYNDLQERLNCLWENGYPYANLCGYTSSRNGLEICTGPFVIINAFAFSEKLPLDEALFQEIGEFRLWRPYKHTQVLAFLAEIERRFGVVDARADFEQMGPGSVRMVVKGSVPRSSLSGGLFYTQSNNVQVSLSGRHYQSLFAPGFMNYSLYSEPANGTRGGSVSLPIGVSRSWSTMLNTQASDIKRYRYDNEVVQIGVAVQRHTIEPITIFRPTQFEIGFTSSELTTNFGAFDRSNYGTLSFSWAIPLKSNELDIILQSHLQDTLDFSTRLAFSSLYKVFNISGPFSNIFINTSGQTSLGPVEDAPVRERIYLGGANLRGYRIDEIGTEALSVSQWGGKLALSLKIDAMEPVTPISNNFLAGLHFDLGYFEPSVAAGSFYTSFGLVARYQFDDQGSISASFSTNKNDENIFSLSINLN